jgi:hypothetical protein
MTSALGFTLPIPLRTKIASHQNQTSPLLPSSSRPCLAIHPATLPLSRSAIPPHTQHHLRREQNRDPSLNPRPVPPRTLRLHYIRKPEDRPEKPNTNPTPHRQQHPLPRPRLGPHRHAHPLLPTHELPVSGQPLPRPFPTSSQAIPLHHSHQPQTLSPNNCSHFGSSQNRLPTRQHRHPLHPVGSRHGLVSLKRTGHQHPTPGPLVIQRLHGLHPPTGNGMDDGHESLHDLVNLFLSRTGRTRSFASSRTNSTRSHHRQHPTAHPGIHSAPPHKHTSAALHPLLYWLQRAHSTD